jgi:hypothetical protein
LKKSSPLKFVIRIYSIASRSDMLKYPLLSSFQEAQSRSGLSWNTEASQQAEFTWDQLSRTCMVPELQLCHSSHKCSCNSSPRLLCNSNQLINNLKLLCVWIALSDCYNHFRENYLTQLHLN